MNDTVTVAKTLNIFQRINEVRKVCPYVKKDKKVDGAGYMAVTHDAVTAELRLYLIEQGIVVVPRLRESKVVQDTGMTTAKNIPIIRYEATYEVDFVNVDEPADKVTVPIEAHALDNGDKAPGKAASYATKYAMLKLFSIETGEGEEERMTDAKAKQKKDLAAQVVGASVTPNAGAGENLSPKEKERLEKIASEIIDCFEAQVPDTALKVYEEADLDVDSKNFLWTFLDSGQRRKLKDLGQAKRDAAQKPDVKAPLAVATS